ncbi:hypothetical protein A5634_09930 [Mycobacterium asiaticum]|uniref:Peroxide stress protein YaaA n=1 Tax=Mycobacterium asiaticum TaxID=1790 RepID=A0A1A3NMQ9_MYCAS|nr:peroxide stress protein YaaA [Mycobacterium asiaticum]OBK21622.1 hypothetical protein A5634_09930 [Mycobacterium asiaticum]
MIVLLPPSETKRGGGDGPPLRLERLSNPELNPLRSELIRELVDLASDPVACRSALGVSASQNAEIERNAALRTAPTLPAIRRYTGVLYDALDIDSLRHAEAVRAGARLVIGSALFGLLRADDQAPAYRLSAGSRLPAKPTLPVQWRPLLEPILAQLTTQDLVVDLRSGSYRALGRTPSAIRVDVLAEHPDGRRTVVTHFNKAYKGRLARALATTRAEPDTAAAVATVARRAGMRVERTDNELTVVVTAGPDR